MLTCLKDLIITEQVMLEEKQQNPSIIANQYKCDLWSVASVRGDNSHNVNGQENGDKFGTTMIRT